MTSSKPVCCALPDLSRLSLQCSHVGVRTRNNAGEGLKSIEVESELCELCLEPLNKFGEWLCNSKICREPDEEVKDGMKAALDNVFYVPFCRDGHAFHYICAANLIRTNQRCLQHGCRLYASPDVYETFLNLVDVPENTLDVQATWLRLLGCMGKDDPMDYDRRQIQRGRDALLEKAAKAEREEAENNVSNALNELINDNTDELFDDPSLVAAAQELYQEGRESEDQFSLDELMQLAQETSE